jgi:hypothetical protein
LVRFLIVIDNSKAFFLFRFTPPTTLAPHHAIARFQHFPVPAVSPFWEAHLFGDPLAQTAFFGILCLDDMG